MEDGQNKESKASSDEIDSPEQSNDDVGTGRSYECIFCKRGFSTAQALGGHMNIHRKDRARMRQNPVPSVSGNPDGDLNYGYYQSNVNHRPFYPPVSESLKNYSMYFPAPTSFGGDTRVSTSDEGSSRRPRELSLFGDRLHLGSSMDDEGTRVEDGEEKRKDEEEGELDLELRLGHVP